MVVTFSAVALIVGTRFALRGDYVEAALGVGFAVSLLALVVGGQYVSRGHSSLRADRDPTGTTLTPDRFVSAMGTFFVVIATAVVLGFVILLLTGHVHMSHSRRAQAILVTTTGVGASAAIASLLTVLRRGIGYVKLTPSGIDIADVRWTRSVSWDDVVAVDDHSEVTKRTRKAIVLRLQDGTEKIIDGADLYVPNGVGLYWMVRHYWRHVEDRVELVDGRALERLRDGRFDTSVP